MGRELSSTNQPSDVALGTNEHWRHMFAPITPPPVHAVTQQFYEPSHEWANEPKSRAVSWCESNDQITVVSPNGIYMGKWQFDLTTWRGVGGEGLPNQASEQEQDYRAWTLFMKRGWQPWQCA